MDIKGILFDKDGTLIEFHSFWVQAAKRVVPEFLAENQISPDQKHVDVVMEAMGVFGDDIDPNGALAYKSNKEIAEEITEALASKGIYIDSRKAQSRLSGCLKKLQQTARCSFRHLQIFQNYFSS
jgi:phosphoglycolate phosphatase